MKLYELTNDFQRLFDSLEDMTENAELTAEEKAEAEKVWFDTLECVEAEFTDKAEKRCSLCQGAEQRGENA